MIFSAGWNRFQSIPLLFKEERNGKLRYLKYTPEND